MAHFHQGDNVKCMWLTLEAMICFFILCVFTELSITPVKCAGVQAGGVPRRASLPERHDLGLLVASSCCHTSLFTVRSRILSKGPRYQPDRVDLSMSHPACGFVCSRARLAACLTLPSTQPNPVTIVGATALPSEPAWPLTLPGLRYL